MNATPDQMTSRNAIFMIRTALIVALGGFLMGFDASVISGVVTFIEPEFDLTRIELGWSVASLTLTATIAMMLSGPMSDRLGRRPVLKLAAVLFAVSAIACALAPNFAILVAARMLGGLGVGALWMLLQGASPHSLRGLVLLLAMGVLATAAQMMMTRAYRIGHTLSNASLQYLGIVFSFGLGVLLFDDPVTWMALLGMLLIVIASLAATFLRSRQLHDSPESRLPPTAT